MKSNMEGSIPNSESDVLRKMPEDAHGKDWGRSL